MKNLKSLKVFVLTAALASASAVLLHAQDRPRSYYVSAAGDDNNNGRSEAAPFKTLGKAVEASKAGVIKTITVIGTIGNERRGISISNTGTDEILITGIPGTQSKADLEKAAAEPKQKADAAEARRRLAENRLAEAQEQKKIFTKDQEKLEHNDPEIGRLRNSLAKARKSQQQEEAKAMNIKNADKREKALTEARKKNQADIANLETRLEARLKAVYASIGILDISSQYQFAVDQYAAEVDKYAAERDAYLAQAAIPDVLPTVPAQINSEITIAGSSKIRFTHIQIKGNMDIKYYGTTPEVTMGKDAVVNGYISLASSSLTMTDNANVTGIYGSGMLIMRDNASITNNKSGGASGRLDITMSGNARISNNGRYGIGGANSVTLSDNAEISGNGGNGLRVDSGTVTISGNVKINGNEGAGVCLTDKATLNMSGGIISGNTGGAYDSYGKRLNNNGGGIYIGDSSSYGNAGTCTISGGTITGNKAEYGAGVYIENGTLNFTGGSITGNEAGFVGGGVYVKRGATYTAGGGTVSGNTAGDGGPNVFRQQ